MKKYYLFFILFIKLTTNVLAQYQEADRNFDRLWYVKAAEQYEEVYKKGNTSQELLQKIGDSYYFNTDMENAEKWYEILFNNYGESIDSNYLFRYIHALKGTKKYRGAKNLMVKYADQVNNQDTSDKQLAVKIKLLDSILNSNPKFFINDLPSINSKFSDFGTAYYGDKIVFSSTRDTLITKTRIYKWNNQPYLELYITDTIKYDGSHIKNIQKFSETINTKYHEAAVTFNKDLNTVYFTRNNFLKKVGRDENGMNHLKLYKATLIDDEWTNIVELPFNSEQYSVGHPALSPDGKKLYFISDMPGSIGETDIFVVDLLEDGTFSNPKNLGPKINTSGREMFPFVTKIKLYFASDTHIGLGGLDVFESKIKNGNLLAPENLGPQLNSNLDDFAYIVNEITDKGFFSSNREGGLGSDDIYSFNRYPECNKIKGAVFDRITNDIIVDAKIELINKKNQVVDSTRTDSKGTYLFNFIDCETRYSIKVAKESYFTKETKVNPDNEFTIVSLEKNLSNLGLGEDLGKILALNPIYFDLGKSYIRKDAMVELSKIVDAMIKYPQLNIEIRSHTDSRAGSKFNLVLSDARAKSTLEYLIKRGVSRLRITSKGYGESQLTNNCSDGVECTEEEHQLNRRSEFIVISNKEL